MSASSARGVGATAVGVCATVLALGACTSELLVEPQRTTALTGIGEPWVIVVYFAAGDELLAATRDTLNALEAVGLGGSGVTVLAFLAGDRRLYEVADDPRGMHPEFASIPLEFSDDGLAGLLAFVRDRYAPEHIALFLSGPGHGIHTPLAVPARDATLTTAAIGASLSGGRLDLVGIDAGYTAAIEVAYELRRRAGILVASQGAGSAEGWPYAQIVRRFARSDLSPRSLADAVVDAVRDEAQPAASTVSAIDLERVDALHEALDGFCDALYEQIGDDALRTAVRSTLFYDAEDFYTTPGDLAIDIGDVARLIPAVHGLVAAEAFDLSEAVARAVLRNHAPGSPGSSGISLHLIPLDADGRAAASHHPWYLADYAGADRLQFVGRSMWVANPSAGTGLLYRLFYEALP